MLIWAHRGASAYAPANTLAAFSLAVQMQADGVELDVRMTRDRELVVTHDERADRLSDGYGRIGDLTLKELKRFNYRGAFRQYERIQIPTLRETLEFLRPTSLSVNVELKEAQNPDVADQCVALADRLGMRERILYSSFHHVSLRRIHQLDASLPVGLLLKSLPEDPVGYAQSQHARAVHPYYPLLYRGGVADALKAANLLIHPWTADDPDDMRILMGLGVDALITNRPDVAMRVRNECVTDR